MGNNICVLIPYFGRINKYFNLWAFSASKNTGIDFYIISDVENRDSIPDYSNLFFIESSLEELKIKFSNFFGFDCCLEKPYKLCDYKPFYYVLYPTIVSKYRYWGFSDIDLIYGDILGLIPADYNKYDVLFKLGHFSLIKNNKKVNSLIVDNVKKDIIKKVYSTNEACYFDEREFSRYNLALKNNMIVFNGDSLIADIYSYSPVLRLVKDYKSDQKLLFEFDDGRLFGYETNNNMLLRNNYIYIHLQKRKMSNHVKKINCFFINGYSFFSSHRKVTTKFVKKHSNKCLVSKFRIFIYLRLKPKLRKLFY